MCKRFHSSHIFKNEKLCLRDDLVLILCDVPKCKMIGKRVFWVRLWLAVELFHSFRENKSKCLCCFVLNVFGAFCPSFIPMVSNHGWSYLIDMRCVWILFMLEIQIIDKVAEEDLEIIRYICLLWDISRVMD